MEKTLETVLDALPLQTLYVLVRWPYYETFKRYQWFDDECVYYKTWDPDSIIRAYFVPLERIAKLHAQGDPELFLFTAFG